MVWEDLWQEGAHVIIGQPFDSTARYCHSCMRGYYHVHMHTSCVDTCTFHPISTSYRYLAHPMELLTEVGKCIDTRLGLTIVDSFFCLQGTYMPLVCPSMFLNAVCLKSVCEHYCAGFGGPQSHGGQRSFVLNCILTVSSTACGNLILGSRHNLLV